MPPGEVWQSGCSVVEALASFPGQLANQGLLYVACYFQGVNAVVVAGLKMHQIEYLKSCCGPATVTAA